MLLSWFAYGNDGVGVAINDTEAFDACTKIEIWKFFQWVVNTLSEYHISSNEDNE